MRELRKQLKHIRQAVPELHPDTEWVKQNRARLCAQMNNMIGAREERQSFVWAGRMGEWMHVFVPQRLAYGVRSFGIFILAGAVTVSSWIGVSSASSDSLPGEALYQVKLATEKTELIVASVIGSDEQKVSTLLKHASHRAEEFKKSVTPGQAQTAISSLKKTIETTNEQLKDVEDAEPKKAVAIAQVVTEKTDRILTLLGESETELVTPIGVTGSTLTSVTTTALVAQQTLNQTVEQTANLVEEANVNAIAVIVGRSAAADTPVNTTAVKAAVEKKLEKITTDLEAISKDAALVGSVVTQTIAATSTTGMTTVVPLLGATTTMTSTLSVSATMGLVPPEVVNPAKAVEKVQTTEQTVAAASKVAEKTVAEAKTLIENNDLAGAVRKVQELQTVKKEAESAVAEAKQISNVLITAPLLIPTMVTTTAGGVTPLTTATTTPQTVTPTPPTGR